MSVPKSRRGVSSMEFFHNARAIRKWLNDWLMRDFGARPRVLVCKSEERTEDEKKLLEYPAWFIAQARAEVKATMHALMNNIVAANTIYPTTVDEADLRRRYHDLCIANCQQLLEEITDVADTLPIKLGGVKICVDMIKKEIKLLKGWRKAANEIRKKIVEKGAA